MNIAEKYLVKKQTEANGLKDSEIKITNSAILSIIRPIPREAESETWIVKSQKLPGK